MSKVTSRLQVTVPKALAGRYGIRPGDDVRFEEAGDVIRVVPANVDAPVGGLGVDARLRLFDAATARQRTRKKTGQRARRGGARVWTREELYERGDPDAD